MESRWVGRGIKVARKREAVAERWLPELCAKIVFITMYRWTNRVQCWTKMKKVEEILTGYERE